MSIRNCKNCGGTHFGSKKCPFIEPLAPRSEPPVDKSLNVCATCGIKEWPNLMMISPSGFVAAPVEAVDEINRLTSELSRVKGERDEAQTRMLNIARGCTDYGGGHRGNAEHFEIYQHGIQTVINALEGAAKNNPNDTQVNALERIGRPKGETA